MLREAYPDVSITARGNNLKLSGDKKNYPKSKVEAGDDGAFA
jgi:hypothetical protein